MAYTVSEEQKKQFAAAYVLDQMVHASLVVPLMLESADKDLEPVLEYLMMKGYVEICGNEAYAPTEKGAQVLTRFSRRYRDFLINFDVYCAVDLGEGTFASERYFDFESNEEWADYLEDDRWEDLRIPVAVLKGLDPVEIVFMSFLREGRFGRREEGWQFDLLLGSVWDEILEVCNTALTLDELAYTADDGETVSGENVLKDVVIQGAELSAELHRKEREERREREDDERRNESYEPDDDDDEDEVVYVESVHYCADPFYLAPWWALIVFL